MFLKDLSKLNADMVDGKHASNSANNLAVLDSNAKLPINQIPTGTSSTTVSLGNHNHDGTYTKPTGTITANRVAVFNDTTGRVIKDSGYTIATSVPSNAKFTDTVYTHPNDANTRHVTDAEKSTWNAKESTSGAQAKADAALASAKSYTDSKVAELVDSSPEALDTLNELAQALGNDANFATTVTEQIGTKADTTYVNSELAKKAAASHTHNYAGSSSAGGAANSAVKLSTARTLSATGDATGSMSFDGSKDVSMALTLANSGVTSGSYGPSANATANFGGTISVPQVTVDSKGRVTSAGTKTITLPSNPNTDTKVTNTLNAKAKAYITGTTGSTTNTGTQVFDTGVYLDETEGTLVAATFKGSLVGNATTATTATKADTANSATTATSATKATQDSAGQQINSTYIKGLSVSGKTITYTKGDGTTGTITTQDTNTTYSTGTSTALGLTKLYAETGTNTDGTMTQSAIKSALDTKASSSHTHNYAGSSSAGGSANSAVKLATARTINGTSFDGSANITTANWGTARNISISDNDGSNTGSAVSVNGSGNVTLKLPSTIKAGLSGNASTATKLATARTITLKGNTNGSVSFDGSGNVTISTHSRIFSGAGTSGTAGFVAFAQVVVTNSYTNRPIEFKIISRGRQTAGTISMMFVNTDTKDPSLSSLKYWGSDYGVFAHKTAASTWLLYCTKSEAYDEITLVGNDYATQGVTITYPGSFITEKPTSNVTNASIGGNFGHANTSNSATKATQDSAGQQINSTYIKGLSVSGRTITYTKGDGTTGTITTQDSNTTYTAGTGMSLSGTTFNHSNSVTAGTAKGDDSKTLSWGGTFTIPTVTYDAQGHVTGKGTTTMTMPSNPNSDTKVTNTLNTKAKAYITGTTSSSTNTGTQVFDTGVYLDEAEGKLVATTFAGALSGNASSATKATQDSAGQQINTTYIKGLSVSGKTITYTKGDGTTGTITTQDTNTTYSTGTASALGLTKLYTGTGTATDGTMTQAAIKTALDGKANSSHGRHVPDACTTITDWNSATTNGWYMGNDAANAPTASAWYFGEVVAHNANYVIQTVYQFTASTDAKAIPKYIRAKMNGTWGAWTNVTVAKAVPSNAVFTDTNTWRGVQDNLTSTATDQSLSANQGKVLKGLIDGKAASSHTHNYAGSSSAGGAANSATKLATARTINGTSFDGSGNITTSQWGTARNISVADSDATNTGSAVSVNGSANVTLKLPATIKASLNGNASTATKAAQLTTARKIGRADFNGTANIELGAIAGRATISSSADTNANKFSKFARIDVSGGTYRTCSGTLEFIPTEGSSFTGELYYYFRTGSAITSTSIVLDWKTISNTSYTASVVAVKVSDGVYDLYYKPVGTWDTMSVTNVNSTGTSYMTLYSSQGYVNSVTAAATSRLNNAASTVTGNASTSTKATQDSAGQQINTTYIKGLSVSGKTITYTKGDGTTGTITTQDTNTTYSTGTASTAGLTKLYTSTGTATDGTMTQAAINSALGGKANSSHTHSSLTGISGSTIAPSTGTGVVRYDYNVSSSNAGTLPVSNNANGVLTLNTHSGNYYNQLGFSSNGNLYYRAFNGVALNTTTAWKQIAFTDSSITGNASTATTLQTARTINGTSFNGSGNITTANWGTARTLTIGSTGKSVNGSGNVSWSLSEIGAASASHSHSTLTGVSSIKFGGDSGPVLAHTSSGGINLSSPSIVLGGGTLMQITSSNLEVQALKAAGASTFNGSATFNSTTAFGGIATFNNTILGMGNIALSNGSLYLGTIPATKTCDYLRIGANIVASDSSTKTIHMIDTGGNPAKLQLASVVLGGKNLSIAASAPSSPATGDVWIQI